MFLYGIVFIKFLNKNLAQFLILIVRWTGNHPNVQKSSSSKSEAKNTNMKKCGGDPLVYAGVYPTSWSVSDWALAGITYRRRRSSLGMTTSSWDFLIHETMFPSVWVLSGPGRKFLPTPFMDGIGWRHIREKNLVKNPKSCILLKRPKIALLGGENFPFWI